MKLKREFIHKLPKTDLHVHLDGSLRMSTIFDLAKIQNVKLPADNEAELKAMIACADNCESLDQYLKAFDITLSVMQTEEALIAWLMNWRKTQQRIFAIWKCDIRQFCTQKWIKKLTQISDARLLDCVMQRKT